jgi:hypothetical protein
MAVVTLNNIWSYQPEGRGSANDLGGLCHFQWIIRARKYSSKSITFIPSMRSTLATFQLAVTVLLAIVPVRFI